jgi:hypothetical protein
MILKNHMEIPECWNAGEKLVRLPKYGTRVQSGTAGQGISPALPSYGFGHCWALASRPMPSASTFRHPGSQSGTVAFWYRTGFTYPGSGLVPVSIFLLIPVQD